MRLDRLHMLVLFLFLPNRNAFASINKRIVLTQPTVILVSYDGFRWDYMEKVPTPNLNFIASNGIKAKHLLNTFVTKTFPNHFTLVTGLYEESHGIVANTFFDPIFNDTFYQDFKKGTIKCNTLVKLLPSLFQISGMFRHVIDLSMVLFNS